MLYPMEQKLMSILWANTPVTAAHLARLAADEIGWKRTTTYTVVARLAERGIVAKEGKLVRPLITREEAEDAAIRTLLTDTFDGDRVRLSAALKRVLPPAAKEENQSDPIDIPTDV